MRTIWKFPIKIHDRQQIKAPSEWGIVHVGLDPNKTPCVWAEVDTDSVIEEKTICVHGTGHEVTGYEEYFGSFVSGPFVWHVYEEIQ